MKSSRLVLLFEATLLAFPLASVCSVDINQVENLECYGSTLCEPAIQTCFLYRCSCPPKPSTAPCSPRSHVSYSWWYYYCCGLIPPEFHSVRNVLQVDDYTTLIDGGYTVRYRVTLWSKHNTVNATWKNTGNQILTWRKTDTVIPEYFSISDTFPAESLPAMEVHDALSNISESAGPLLQIQLDKCYDAGSDYKMNFMCTKLFNTTCIVKNCSCWTSSSNYIPSQNRKGILLPEHCSVLDDSKFNVTTSSTLSPLHAVSNSINEWKNGTFGGWAPADDDMEPWMQFSNITGNVSAVMIQGMAGDAIRSLGKFAISNCANTTFETFNHHGAIFNSFTIHYVESLSSTSNCLKIKILEPNDTTKIGFRAGLISCNDTSEDYQSAHDIACVRVCTSKESTYSTPAMKLSNLNSTIAAGTENSQVGAEAVAQTFRGVAEDFSNINKSEFAKTFDQTLDLPNIELNVNYQPIQNFKQRNGFEFDRPSISASNASNLSIRVPNQVFVDFVEDSSVTMVVGQTMTTDDGGPNAVVMGRKGKIVSPVITLMTLIDNNYTSLDNVSMEFSFEADNKSEVTVGSFRELEAYEDIEWDVDGCTSEFNRTTRRVAIQCNHTTSFAVILLIGKRTLPEWAEKLAEIITKVGCSLSSVSLAAALVTYLFFRTKIDSYQFTIHFNLMAAILASLLVFIGLVEHTELEIVCQITKYTLQYLFLAVFFWMLCEGIHLHRKIITVFETKTRHLFVFYIIGWGMPLILVAITIGSLSLLHKQGTRADNKGMEDQNPVCFLSYEDSSIWYFAVPAVIIIAINTYILLRITIVVVKASKIQTQAAAQKIHQAKTGIRSALLLMPLLGSSYILGLAASIDPVFELLFNVINSLQGFFIALFYCGLNSEITEAVRKLLQRGQDARSILTSQPATAQKNGKRFKNKIGQESTASTTLIDAETLRKLQEI